MRLYVALSMFVLFVVTGCSPLAPSVAKERTGLPETGSSQSAGQGAAIPDQEQQSISPSTGQPVQSVNDSTSSSTAAELPAGIEYETVLLDPLGFVELENSDYNGVIATLPGRNLEDLRYDFKTVIDIYDVLGSAMREPESTFSLEGASKVTLYLVVDKDETLPTLPNRSYVTSKVTLKDRRSWEILLDSPSEPGSPLYERFERVTGHTVKAAIGVFSP